ncbi:MAG: hypothetical protein DRQ55_02015 [Planctomycetota bacterium]|nr:MAG: hypothetical protein DRQ55_02015 [Planctomycetota bacterium]
MALPLVMSCYTPFEESRPPEHFVRQSRAVLGAVDFTLFHVPTHGLLRDRQYVEASKAGAPTDRLADDLAAILRRGATPPGVTVSVAGGGSAKTARVVEEAFSYLTGLQLPELDLLVIVDPQHELIVREAAHPSGCQLRVADLDG